MFEVMGSAHFLVIIGLWAIYLERKIEPWPQWTVPVAFVILVIGIALAAGMVGLAYS